MKILYMLKFKRNLHNEFVVYYTLNMYSDDKGSERLQGTLDCAMFRLRIYLLEPEFTNLILLGSFGM